MVSSVFGIDPMALFLPHPPDAQHGRRWPHFTAEELSCPWRTHSEGAYLHDARFLEARQAMRREMGRLIICWGHLCRAHNSKAGGVPNSFLTKAIAADMAGAGKTCANATSWDECRIAGLGYGRSFLHMDIGPARARTYPGTSALKIKAFGVDTMGNPLKPHTRSA